VNHTVTTHTDSLLGGLQRALADAWALIAPVDCAGCGAHDRALCPSCVPHLQPRPLLGTLDLALPAALRLLSSAHDLPVVAALPYDGVARRVVLAFKEEARTELARALAPALAGAVERVWRGTGAELLVPIPGSWAAAGRRGFEPVALVARRAGLATTPALRARRAPRTGAAQKSLTLAERQAADASRWHVSPRVRGRRVVLVDDVVTSGATLRAAALALIAAGAEVAGCAAIAATPRRAGVSSIPWRFMADHDEGPGDNDPAEDYREGKEA
jgi:predicted amidophosphoribosyltransferase